MERIKIVESDKMRMVFLALLSTQDIVIKIIVKRNVLNPTMEGPLGSPVILSVIYTTPLVIISSKGPAILMKSNTQKIKDDNASVKSGRFDVAR